MDFRLFSLGESPKNVASTVLVFKMSDTMLAIEPHSVMASWPRLSVPGPQARREDATMHRPVRTDRGVQVLQADEIQ